MTIVLYSFTSCNPKIYFYFMVFHEKYAFIESLAFGISLMNGFYQNKLEMLLKQPIDFSFVTSSLCLPYPNAEFLFKRESTDKTITLSSVCLFNLLLHTLFDSCGHLKDSDGDRIYYNRIGHNGDSPCVGRFLVYHSLGFPRMQPGKFLSTGFVF